MELEQIFSVAGLLAMIGWLILAILPKQPIAQVVSGVVIPLVLSAGSSSFRAC